MRRAIVFMLIVALLLGTAGFGVLFFYTNDAKADLAKELEKSQSDEKELKKKYSELKSKYDRVLSGENIWDVEYEDEDDDDDDADKEEVSKPAGKFNETTVASALKVTTYSYSDDDWGYYYYFLAVENTSDFTIDLTADVKFYKSGDQLVGAQSDTAYNIGKGQTVLLSYSPDEAYIRAEYEFTVSEETYYTSCVSDLTLESTAATDKEIVEITNNGSEAAESVNVSALFFKNGAVVDHSTWNSFQDADYELKAGKSIAREISCYEEYDDVEFYIEGYRSSSSY